MERAKIKPTSQDTKEHGHVQEMETEKNEAHTTGYTLVRSSESKILTHCFNVSFKTKKLQLTSYTT